MTEDAVRHAPIETRLAWLGILTAAVDLGSAYVKFPLASPGITWGDAIHLLGTFSLLGLYAWVALALLGRYSVPRAWIGWVLVLAGVAYALGFGIHVAANSIHDMLDRTGGGDPWGLAYFWDEHAGHIFIDCSRASLAVGLTAWEERSRTAGMQAAARPAADVLRAPLILGALAYGFIYFATGVEGQTVPLALPFSAAYAIWSLARRRVRPGCVRMFYTFAAVVSLIFFAFWGIANRGFPEFSKTGVL